MIGGLGFGASIAGCTVAADDNNPFGTAPVVTSAPPAGDTGDGDTETSTGAGATVGETGPGPTGGSSVGDTTAGNAEGPVDATMGSSSSTGGGPGPGPGMQPGMGMYSPCTVPQDCGFSPDLCMTITDLQGVVLAGFCSRTPCADPVADCDPSPGGTAVPTCVPVTLDGMANTACALDCSGGATCPAPMECFNLGATGMWCA